MHQFECVRFRYDNVLLLVILYSVKLDCESKTKESVQNGMNGNYIRFVFPNQGWRENSNIACQQISAFQLDCMKWANDLDLAIVESWRANNPFLEKLALRVVVNCIRWKLLSRDGEGYILEKERKEWKRDGKTGWRRKWAAGWKAEQGHVTKVFARHASTRDPISG